MKRCVPRFSVCHTSVITFVHQINNLKAQVEAHKTKTGLLQQRLASALASLDYVQNQHLLELASEQLQRKHAEAKLRRYIDVVQAAEVERDDLRDAVMKLVVKGAFLFFFLRCINTGGKVEECFVVESENNDFKTWPRSYMQVTSLLGGLSSEHRTCMIPFGWIDDFHLQSL